MRETILIIQKYDLEVNLRFSRNLKILNDCIIKEDKGGDHA